MQERWHPDPDEHRAALAAGIRSAAEQGAQLVCLQELTLSRYFAVDPGGPNAAGAEPEDLPGGPTLRVSRHGSRGRPVSTCTRRCTSAPGRHEDGLGYNTAIIVAPDGELLARTRKLHIPVTAGYHEDRYFRPGPVEGDPFPVIELQARGSGCRRAGTSGSPRSRAPTASRAPTS